MPSSFTSDMLKTSLSFFSSFLSEFPRWKMRFRLVLDEALSMPGSIVRLNCPSVTFAELRYMPPSGDVRFFMLRDAVTYLAEKKVSTGAAPEVSGNGCLSMTATSFSMTALKGATWILPMVMSPSMLFFSEARILSAIYVCTAGDCTAIRAATMSATMVMIVR